MITVTSISFKNAPLSCSWSLSVSRSLARSVFVPDESRGVVEVLGGVLERKVGGGVGSLGDVLPPERCLSPCKAGQQAVTAHRPCTHTGLHSLPMQHAVMHNLQQYTSCCSSHAYHNARLHWPPTQDAVIHNLSFQAMHTYTAALATDATCSDTSNTLALAMHIATHGCTGY